MDVGWMDGWTDGWMDVGWMDGRMDGWVDEHMDGQMNRYHLIINHARSDAILNFRIFIKIS